MILHMRYLGRVAANNEKTGPPGGRFRRGPGALVSQLSAATNQLVCVIHSHLHELKFTMPIP